MTTKKSFTFGVLNTSETDETTLRFRAIVSPALYKNNKLALPVRENAEQFESLLAIPDVAYRLAKQHLQLAVPKVPDFYVGTIVPVDLGNVPSDGPPSQARLLLRTMGPVNTLKALAERGLEKASIEGNSSPLKVPHAALQECALSISLPDKPLGYAFRVDHVTKEGRPIGDITIVFLPDPPQG